MNEDMRYLPRNRGSSSLTKWDAFGTTYSIRNNVRRYVSERKFSPLTEDPRFVKPHEVRRMTE